MRISIVSAIIFFSLIGIVGAIPSISFIPPTPDNNSINSTGSIYVNTLVLDATNSTALLNWNSSLISWWRLDEAPGGVLAEDYSGFNRNGTWYGNTTSNVTTGRFGNAILFDGTNNYISTSAYIIPNNTNAITTSFWVKMAQNTNKNTFLAFDENVAGTYWFYRRASDDAAVYEYSNGSTPHKDTRMETYFTGFDKTWVLVTVVANYSSRHVLFYRNGIMIQDNTIAEAMVFPNRNIGKYIGSFDGTGNYCACIIDDMRIYNRALSNDEINATYNGSAYRLYNNFTGLPNGIYNYTAYVQNTIGGMNQTETRYVTVSSDSSLVFNGDFETGNTNQWENVCEAQAGRISVVTSPVRQGNYTASFTVTDGDDCEGGERAEVATTSNEKEGTDLYYAWSTLFPSDWKTDTVWGTVFNQYHDFNDRSPPLAFIADELGGMVLVFCTGNVGESGDCSAGYYSVTLEKTLTKGLWHDFILHVKWSTTNAGQVEVWHRLENQANFTKIVNVTNRPTLQWKLGNPSDNATITTHQLGLYRGSGNGFSQTFYQDGYRIGTSYDSVLYNVHTPDTMKINYDYVLAYLRNLKEQYGGYFGTDLSNLAHELKVMIFGLKKRFEK